MKRWPLVLLVAALADPTNALAQDDLLQQCSTSIPSDAARRFCNLVSGAAALAQPRIGLVLTGGNPLPGAASTLGTRAGALPHASIGTRVTAAGLDLPAIHSIGSSGELDAWLPALNVDASIALFDGVALLPTVGGFASIDLVASGGVVPVADPDGFETGTVTSWAVGARIGILRESFTAPGVSLTGMYRRINGLSFGERSLASADSYFEAEDFGVLSLRAVAGKRVAGVGLSGGLGYVRYGSEVALGVRNPAGGTPARFDLPATDLTNSRAILFAGAHWTMLIMSLVGEIGWQSGGDDFAAPLPAGRSLPSNGGAFFGTLAVRVAL
jgi:hypothetical protein